ncbi:MAG TPA: DUF2079 domain-containing protein [Jatrophihabitans sp.]|jgi:uncharacterized membrane protein
MTAAQQPAVRASFRSRLRLPDRLRFPLWLQGEYAPVAALSVLSFGVYTLFALLGHRQFNTAGYDLGIFDQAVRQYAHFHAPMVALKGPGYNIFGDHFHPIIAVAAPLYWIWDNPQTLLILQSALIAVSVPVIYRFARRRTSARVSLTICFSYAFSWAFQTMVNFSFHEVAYGVPLLALAIDALDRNADRQLLVYSGLLLLVREDMGILLILIGVLRVLRRPRWPGIALLVAGVVMYELATAVILPHFSPTGQFAYWQYGSTLGKDLPTAVVHSLTHPWHVVRLFFSPITKTRTLSLLLLPLLLLPLRSRYSLLALPLLAQRFFEPAERYRLWEPHYHYNALPWVILVLAMTDGAARLKVFDHRRLTAALCVVLIGFPIYAIALIPDVAPLHRLFTGQEFRLNAEMKYQQAALGQIPSNVCVAADDRLAAHLTNRDWVTIPGLDNYRADLIVIDLSQKTVGGNDGPKPALALATAQSHGYQITYRNGPIRILTSPDYAGPSSECHPLGTGKPG